MDAWMNFSFFFWDTYVLHLCVPCVILRCRGLALVSTVCEVVPWCAARRCRILVQRCCV